MKTIRYLLALFLLTLGTIAHAESISVSPVILEPGGIVSIPVNCEFSCEDITLYQFDLYLPEGVTLVKNAKGRYAAGTTYVLSDRHDEHTASLKDNGGFIRFVVVSQNDGYLITPGEGLLLTLYVQADASVSGELQASIKNFMMFETDETKHAMSDVTFKMMVPSINQNIQFADAAVKAICVANWDTDGDGELSMDEAAQVMDIGTLFKSNETITSFNELQYFTGLTIIGDSAFCKCSDLTSITIPESVNSIRSYAFFSCNSLKSATIPGSVITIGEFAFYRCTGLTSVILENGVTNIGHQVFGECTGLTEISIPNSVTSIGAFVFGSCISLASVTIPESVTSISNTPFFGCSGLTSIKVASGNPKYDSRHDCNAIIETSTNTLIAGCQNTIIPNGVINIDYDAFWFCSSLTSISIPNSVTNIRAGAFEGCGNLASIIIGSDVTSIGTDAFKECNNLTSVTLESNAIVSATRTASTSLKTIFGEQVKNYVIGDGVSAIGAYAFNGCSNMQSVTIGRNVTSMSSNAFSGCTGITTVNLKSNSIVSTSRTSATSMKAIFGKQVKKYVIDYGVRAIGDYAFSGYTGLTAFTIPKSVATIGNYAFQGCTGLTSMSIPNSVTSIGNYAFQGCTGLKSVSIPNSVTNIGDYAFSGCTGLTSMVFPESVTSIGKSAFKNCINLKSVSLGKNMTTIWTGTFSGCTGLTSVTIESNALMTTVGKGDDYGNTTRSMKDFFGNQVKEYVIGNSVGTIGDFTFSGCTSLTAMIIPYSVKKIGKYAFDGCTGMTSVTIGSSVETMSAQAFRNCPLLSMKIYRKTPPSLTDLSYSVASKEYYFPDIENITLIVPRGCKTTYKNHPFWGGFRAYMEFDADNITETFTLGCIRGYVGRSGSKLVGTSTFDNASEFALIEYNDTTYLYDVTNKAFVIHSSDNPETVGQYGNQLQESNVNLSKAVKGLKFGATDIEAFPYYLEDCYGNWLNMDGSKNVCMNKWKSFDDGNLYQIETVRTDYDPTEAVTMLKEYYNDQSDTGVDEIQDSTSVITEEDGAWYTLDGRRIDDARPTRKGIYIRNGRKVLVK